MILLQRYGFALNKGRKEGKNKFLAGAKGITEQGRENTRRPRIHSPY